MSSSESQSDGSGGNENESQSGETTNTTGGVDPERGEGKGSGPDDDDDPADGFEDDADSQQLSDAQATVSEFIDDGEASSGDESGQTTPVGGVEGDIESVDVDDGTSDGDTLKTLDDANAPDPERLATGVRAVTDSRSEFIDIRSNIIHEDIDGAENVLEERLTPEEIDTVVNELQIKQEMRREYESIDAVADLEPGQDVIFDNDNARTWETVRGSVEDVNVAEKSATIDAEHQDREVIAFIEDGSLRADPSHESSGGEFDTSNHEPGRFGLASNEEVLNNAFSAAEERNGGREAGILEGNTTGDMQELLTLEDGSQIYATPTNEYEGGTMVVDSKDNAIENNLRGPKIVNALGGDACDTAVVEDKFGKQYIAKEGVEGELAKTDAAGGRYSKESVEDTMAAAYFAGNTDLHGANVIIKEDGNMTIIDNDGGAPQSTMANISKFTGGPLGLMSFDIQDGNTREKIYDKAIQIRSGEQEIPVDNATRHHQYAQDAADKAVRTAVVDSSYDVPDEHTPSNLKSAPDGYESFSDFSVGDTFVAVNEKGEKVDCTVDYVESDASSNPSSGEDNHIKLDNNDSLGGFEIQSTDGLRRIVSEL